MSESEDSERYATTADEPCPPITQPDILDTVSLRGKSLRWWEERGLGTILGQMLDEYERREERLQREAREARAL